MKNLTFKLVDAGQRRKMRETLLPKCVKCDKPIDTARKVVRQGFMCFDCEKAHGLSFDEVYFAWAKLGLENKKDRPTFKVFLRAAQDANRETLDGWVTP